MPDSFHHGTSVTESASGNRYLQTVSTSVIGLVATADDADATKFPQDRAVHGYASDFIGYAGETGTLANSLEQILNQGNAEIVVVRVPEVANDDGETTQDAAVIGKDEAGIKSGMQALLTSKARFGVQPRILGAPGLDTQNVTTEMVSIAQAVGGMAYMHALGESKEDAVTYRGNFGARELMLIWPNAKGYSTSTGATATINATATALGMRAKIDQAQGWWKTISNVAVNGWTDIEKDVSFDLMSTTTDADYLNKNEITTIIQQDGFRLWGNRTCSDEPKFAFESATRTAQIVKDTIGYGLMWAIDKPISRGLITDILGTIQTKLNEWIALSALIGAEVWVDNNLNTATSIAAGKLAISYSYSPAVPLEDLQMQQIITDTYYANLLTGVAA